MRNVNLSGFCSLLIYSIATCCAHGPPRLEQLFTVTIDVAKPLVPIPVAGGVTIVEPFKGGKITGPALNATVTGGLAYPSDVKNKTLVLPEIVLYGTTIPDKVPWVATVSAKGGPSVQIATLNIEIGGRYAALENEQIFGTIIPSADKTVVVVEGYKLIID